VRVVSRISARLDGDAAIPGSTIGIKPTAWRWLVLAGVRRLVFFGGCGMDDGRITAIMA